MRLDRYMLDDVTDPTPLETLSNYVVARRERMIRDRRITAIGAAATLAAIGLVGALVIGWTP